MAAGSIVIDLLMRTGAFETDTKRAEKRLGELKKEATAAGAVIGAAFAGVALAAAHMVKSSIDSMDELSKLSQKVGVGVEALSALKYAADLSDVSQEQLGASLVKLTKNMSEAAQGTGEAMKGFKALGIDVKDANGHLKSSDQVLSEIAGKFAGFKDGAEKTALAVNLFGKSGAELIPLLNSGADGLEAMKKEAEKFGIIVSAEAGKAAEEFNDNLTRLKARVEGVSMAIASGFITSLNSLIAKFDELKAQSTGGALIDGIFGNSAASKLTTDSEAISAAIERTTGAVMRMTEELNRRGGNDQFLETRIKKARERLIELQKEAAATTQKLKDLADLTDPARGKAPDAPATPDAQTDAPKLAPDTTKATLENRLKLIEAGIKREQDLLASRNKFLDLFDGESLMSIRGYYEAKKNAQDIALAAQIAGYDAEIQALRDYREKVKSPEEKESTRGKINDALEKRAEALRRAGDASVEALGMERKATEAYQKSIEALNAQVFELSGNLQAAAAIRFDQANEGLQKRFTAEGNAQGLQALETLRKYTIAQADYNKLQTDSSRVLDQLSLQEDRIAIARQLGANTEVDGLIAVGTARKEAVRQLDAIVAAEEAVAKASGNPALILNAEKSRVALEQLRATADPLRDKFQAIFSEGLGDAFGDFITGTKSASEAFKSFANTVISQLARMAAQQVANAAIGQSSGFLSALSSIFGAGSSTGTFQSGAAMNTGVDATAALPAFAEGTNYIPYDNFPAILHKGESVVPAKYNPAAGGQGSGSTSVTNNYNVSAGVSRNELMAALQLMGKSLRAETDKKLRDKGIA